MPDDVLTIAQISDLHIGPLPRIPLALLDLKRLTGFLNWHRKRRFMHLPSVTERIIADVRAQAPDHIAVTGDLANIGLPSEIERATTWLARIGPPDKVSVIPGNHDIYSKVGGISAGVSALAPWRPWFASNEEGRRYVKDGSDFPYVRVLRRGTLGVALIGLNSAVETPPFVATGRLGETQSNALASVLQDTRRDGLVRVMMIHHPPFYGKADKIELTDTHELRKLLNAHGAELIIHGHKHRLIAHGSDSNESKGCFIVGAPSASMAILREKADRRKTENLASAHFFEISQGSSSETPNITLVARGLAEACGPIVELHRWSLTAESGQSLISGPVSQG